MENYRIGFHIAHDITYHFIWITKYHYSVLTGDIAIRIRTIICEVCMSYDLKIVRGVVSKNHINLLLSAPLTMAPSKIAQLLKEKPSIQQEFPELKNDIGGSICGHEFFCASSRNIKDEMIIEYLDKHKSKAEEDDFVVE